MKEFVSILVVLSIIFTLARCNTSSPSSNESSATNSPSSLYDESVVEGNFEEYTEKIKPAFLTVLCRQSWATPQEINSDMLCSFYSFVILYLEENPSGWDDMKEIPTSDVLNGLSRYFGGITESQIKQADCYDADKDVFVFGLGFGGAAEPKVTDVQYVDNNTVIYYDSVVEDKKNGEGIVTIREINGTFQYLSNKYTQSVK